MSVAEFKVGDRVRLFDAHDINEMRGTVIDVDDEIRVEVDAEFDYGMASVLRFPDEITPLPIKEKRDTSPDPVNHPAHYTQYPVEVIQITEHLNFCRGNAVKYICRAGHKGDELEDLRKSAWYIAREIERLEKSNG